MTFDIQALRLIVRMRIRKLTEDELEALRAGYMPSEEKIAEECAAIQASWSEWERRRRQGRSKVAGEGWNLPRVSSEVAEPSE